MKLNKIYIYPLGVLLSVGFIVSAVLTITHSMGLKVNPPQPETRIEQELTSYIVWIDDVWMGSKVGDFSVFKSVAAGVEKQKLTLLLERDQPEVILINVKSDIGKEKVLSLLADLATVSLKKVYVVSAYDNSLVNMKRAEPRFWYSPSPKTWIKWSLLSSFYMHTIFDIESDFLFVDQKAKEILSSKLEAEIERRNLPVISTGPGDKSVIF